MASLPPGSGIETRLATEAVGDDGDESARPDVTSVTLDPSGLSSAANSIREHDTAESGPRRPPGEPETIDARGDSRRTARSPVKLLDHDEATAGRDTASFGAEFVAAPDRVLVNASAIGDRDAFEAIVLRYGPEMLRYARNMLSDGGAAEEVTQDAFVAAWRGLDDFRGDCSLRTWLFTLVSHKVVDHHRRRCLAPAQEWMFATVPAPVTDDPVVRATNDDFLAELRAALAELPDRQRAAWLLREVDGMTHVEIGRILMITPSAVRGQVIRAKATLSERMAGWR